MLNAVLAGLRGQPLPAGKRCPDQHLGTSLSWPLCSSVRLSFLQRRQHRHCLRGMNGNFLLLVSMTRGASPGKTESKSMLRPRISPNTNQPWLLPVCCLWLCGDFCPLWLQCLASAAQKMRNGFVGMNLGEGCVLSPSWPLLGVKNSDYQIHGQRLASPLALTLASMSGKTSIKILTAVSVGNEFSCTSLFFQLSYIAEYE